MAGFIHDLVRLPKWKTTGEYTKQFIRHIIMLLIYYESKRVKLEESEEYLMLAHCYFIMVFRIWFTKATIPKHMLSYVTMLTQNGALEKELKDGLKVNTVNQFLLLIREFYLRFRLVNT